MFFGLGFAADKKENLRKRRIRRYANKCSSSCFKTLTNKRKGPVVLSWEKIGWVDGGCRERISHNNNQCSPVYNSATLLRWSSKWVFSLLPQLKYLWNPPRKKPLKCKIQVFRITWIKVTVAECCKMNEKLTKNILLVAPRNRVWRTRWRSRGGGRFPHLLSSCPSDAVCAGEDRKLRPQNKEERGREREREEEASSSIAPMPQSPR